MRKPQKTIKSQTHTRYTIDDSANINNYNNSNWRLSCLLLQGLIGMLVAWTTVAAGKPWLAVLTFLDDVGWALNKLPFVACALSNNDTAAAAVGVVFVAQNRAIWASRRALLVRIQRPYSEQLISSPTTTARRCTTCSRQSSRFLQTNIYTHTYTHMCVWREMYCVIFIHTINTSTTLVKMYLNCKCAYIVFLQKMFMANRWSNCECTTIYYTLFSLHTDTSNNYTTQSTNNYEYYTRMMSKYMCVLTLCRHHVLLLTVCMLDRGLRDNSVDRK